jgi:hypothetical protein
MLQLPCAPNWPVPTSLCTELACYSFLVHRIGMLQLPCTPNWHVTASLCTELACYSFLVHRIGMLQLPCAPKWHVTASLCTELRTKAQAEECHDATSYNPGQDDMNLAQTCSQTVGLFLYQTQKDNCLVEASRPKAHCHSRATFSTVNDGDCTESL